MTDGGGGGHRLIVRMDRPVYIVESLDIAAMVAIDK